MVLRTAAAISVLAALLVVGCARQQPPAFAGTWLLKYREKNLMLLTLSVDKQQRVKGTLVRPEHLRADAEGNFHEIHPPLVERPLTVRTTGDTWLELAEEDGSDAILFSLVDSGRAEARPKDAPDHMTPWIFERVTGDAPLMVSDWELDGPQSPGIAAARKKLLAMAKEDQAIRQGKRKISEKAMDELAAKHKPEILRIYKQYGWPLRSEFGVEAADAFWLLVQHQDHKLQKRLLPELERLMAEGEASKQNYTLLFDRVRVGEGKPQYYGNSVQCRNGRPALDPVEDPQNLDQRRAAWNLTPIAEYLKQLEPMCKALTP